MSIQFANASLRVVRGTTWRDDVVLTDKATGAPVSLAGIVGVTMRLRETIDGPVIAELSVTAGTLTVVDAAGGVLGIRCTSAFTQALPENGHEKAKYLYDAVIERSAGEYEPAIAGKVTVLPQVTRPLDT